MTFFSGTKHILWGFLVGMTVAYVCYILTTIPKLLFKESTRTRTVGSTHISQLRVNKTVDHFDESTTATPGKIHASHVKSSQVSRGLLYIC